MFIVSSREGLVGFVEQMEGIVWERCATGAVPDGLIRSELSRCKPVAGGLFPRRVRKILCDRYGTYFDEFSTRLEALSAAGSDACVFELKVAAFCVNTWMLFHTVITLWDLPAAC
eukprot:TRINITY_DN47180_c0_g1_i1.p1 TRINITY_DN47180_c0_g1~~TRINITY_DN47180_c0_g1_i1.p1  ORF type:complete len:115 (-),score=14.41 TRINITY_DN47180_c0_g1_i1:48-392(-)